MKSNKLSLLFLGAALILTAGCSDPDTAALLRSQHHQAVIAKPPAGDPAAQKMFGNYMNAHKDQAGLVPNDSHPQPASK